LRVRRSPAHDRSGEVAEVTGARAAGKHVEDDKFICAKRTTSPLMRITSLAATRDNRVRWNSARPQHCRIDLGPKTFRGQRLPRPRELASLANACLPQHLERAFQTRLGNLQRITY